MKSDRELLFDVFNNHLSENKLDKHTLNIYKNLLIYVLPENNLEIMLAESGRWIKKNIETHYQMTKENIEFFGIFCDVSKKINGVRESIATVMDEILIDMMNTTHGYILEIILLDYYNLKLENNEI